MYLDIFQQIGLSKNESRIYETLLREGESSVGHISTKSEVYRRNVYDSLNRLVEKGLVFEIVSTKENHYQAVDPKKLMDLINEKRDVLDSVLPGLEILYKENPSEHSVLTYKGKEGWKNYMRDMLRIGEPVYVLGGKGGWLDERVKNFFPYFIKEAGKQNLEFFHLFDHEVKSSVPEILKYVGKNYKFLPKKYSTVSSVDVFGDHVNIVTEIHMGQLSEEVVFSVIVNKNVADSFRTWFQLIWDLLPDQKNSGKD